MKRLQIKVSFINESPRSARVSPGSLTETIGMAEHQAEHHDLSYRIPANKMEIISVLSLSECKLSGLISRAIKLLKNKAARQGFYLKFRVIDMERSTASSILSIVWLDSLIACWSVIACNESTWVTGLIIREKDEEPMSMYHTSCVVCQIYISTCFGGNARM